MMTGQAIMTLPHSRPKVHRPPIRVASGQQRPVLGLLLGVALGLWLLSSLRAGGPDPVAEMTEMKTAIEPAQRVEQPQSQQAVVAKTADTIVIQGDNQAIIGQMARIPVYSKGSAEVQTVTNLDKEDGKELLSIVNRY